VLNALAHGRREGDVVRMDVDALVLEPLVDCAVVPALGAEALDDIDQRVVVALVAAGCGLRFFKQGHFDLLDCLTVASAKKSSMTFSTCGLKRRRSALASAAMRAAKARGNDIVLRTVGSVGMGLVGVIVALLAPWTKRENHACHSTRLRRIDTRRNCVCP